MGATKRAGFIFIGQRARKERRNYKLAYGAIRNSKRLAAGWSWSPGYYPVHPSCSSPSSRRAQHRGTEGGTARGKKGEGSNLKRSLNTIDLI